MSMYRQMLYFLGFLFVLALGLSAVGILPYSAKDILLQAIFLAALSWGLNTLFCRVVKTKPNFESPLITALILFFILGPARLPDEWLVLTVATLAAIASKYLLVKNHSHIFNPAAFGALAIAVTLNQPASWWVGSQVMFPAILIGGLWMTKHIRRFHLVLSFLGTYLGLVAFNTFIIRGVDPSLAIKFFQNLLLHSSLLFFVFVMLVEPLTAPQIRKRRIYFGILVGLVLFTAQRFFPQMPYSFELALLIGNAFSRIINPDFRQSFALARKEMLTPDIFSFWFSPTRLFGFIPGQFLEYTLAHTNADSRGMRRYFSIASSPTEQPILLTTRFSNPGSSFKQTLKAMRVGSEIIASKVAGEFTLPKNQNQKLAFIAGGIGITPFRSMVKYLLDTGQARDIILLYGTRSETDLVFKDIFEEARRKFSMRNVYILDAKIDEATIKQQVEDCRERVFYVSGPEPMVQSMEKILAAMDIPRKNIKRDYFPGYK